MHYETSFLLFANARGVGTLLTAKYTGSHRASNARGLSGAMLAAGIDSHITSTIPFVFYNLGKDQLILWGGGGGGLEE